jgi:hypothetical protein
MDSRRQFCGQQEIEKTRIPPSIVSIATSVIVKSRKRAENTAVSMIEPNNRCI